MMAGRLGVLILGLLCSVAQADVYRWVDEQGGVHYGDRQPPPGQEGEQVDLPSTPAPAAPAEKKIDADRLLKTLQEDREARQAEADRKLDEQAEREKRCKALKTRYWRYNNVSSLYELDENGQRRYLSAAEKDEKLAGLREQMEEVCSEPLGTE